MGNLITLYQAKQIREKARQDQKLVVFTNGCFDLIHRGHIEILTAARTLGDFLLVGLNSDQSIRILKGKNRPFIKELDRATVLAALSCVDYVLIFNEETPAKVISSLVPDVLVKGGDWPVDKIVGRETVLAAGGRVLSIERPTLEDGTPKYSTSSIVQQIATATNCLYEGDLEQLSLDDPVQLVVRRLRESALTKQQVAQSISQKISEAASLLVETFQKGNKVLICGNGGSAADAQHLASELVGKFHKERDGFPAIALTTDTSILTAVANDYSFRYVFSKQLKAIAQRGDTLIVISTSGESDNLIQALEDARDLGLSTVGLLGKNGGRVSELVELALIVPSMNTARIQEVHITIGHILCEIVDMSSNLLSL